MKHWKKLLMMLMCVGVIMSVTACGSNNNADDNGAAGNGTANDANGTGNNGTNGATDRNGDNVMDEIGDDIRDGAEDVGDALDGNDNNVRDDDTNSR